MIGGNEMLKKILACAMVVIMSVNLGACGSGAESAPTPTSPAEASEMAAAIKSVLDDKKEVKISFWTGTGQQNFPFIEKMVNEFQKEYPNIAVDFTNQGPVIDLMDKLTQNIVSKTTPTLSNINPTYFLDYIDSEAIIDLKPYYDNAEIGYTDGEKQNFYPYLMEEASKFGPDGTMYGFPTTKKTAEVLIYNKEFFDAHNWEAPVTWDEVAEYSRQIKEETGMPGFSFDIAYVESAFKTLSMQWGSPYLTEDGAADINNEASREAIQFYKTNYDLGYFTTPPDMPSAGGNYSNSGFVVGECYMYVGAAAGIYYAIPKEESGHRIFEVGVAPIPQKDPNHPIAFSTGEDYCIFSNSTAEERVAAWLLIQFLNRDDQNVEWLINTGNLPITSSMVEQPEYKAFLEAEADGSIDYYRAASINAALKMSGYTRYQQVSPISATLASECGTMWQSVIIGGADMDTALEAVAAKVN